MPEAMMCEALKKIKDNRKLIELHNHVSPEGIIFINNKDEKEMHTETNATTSSIKEDIVKVSVCENEHLGRYKTLTIVETIIRTHTVLMDKENNE
jgi:hypothetical protein